MHRGVDGASIGGMRKFCGHWTPGEPPYVVSVRFTMAELDARPAAAAAPRR